MTSTNPDQSQSVLNFAPRHAEMNPPLNLAQTLHEPGLLRVTDPRSGARLCEAQRFMGPVRDSEIVKTPQETPFWSPGLSRPGKPAPAKAGTPSVTRFLEPLDTMAGSPHLVRQPGLRFQRNGVSHELPRYRFVGPRGGGDAMRIGIFATIHGDEPESGLGLLRFLQELGERPEIAQGFVILDPQIDGFHARGGVLSTCYDGVLRAPDEVAPAPFEITFETPQRAPVVRQVEAFQAALLTILSEYRQLLAHAPNL